MRKPNRISLSLFDEELLSLINATAKIFPITQEEIDNNLNTNSYEYARVGNHIYRWSGNKWAYIVADDADIDWSDVKNKPTAYVPLPHDHDRLHDHINKTTLDGVTDTKISLWNTVSTKAPLVHTHPYAPTVHNHDDMYYTESEVDAKLSSKAESNHNHDGAYYKKSEVDSQMGGKASTVHNHTEAQITDLDKYTKVEVDNKIATRALTGHTHPELHNHINKPILEKIIETQPKISYDLSQLQYIEDIRGGYTEGHAHSNFSLLQTITQALVDMWNSAVAHTINKVNPHAVTKTQVNLGSVLNYGIATKAEAEAGTSNAKYTTPLRVKEAITANQYVHPNNHDDWYNTKAEINSLMLMKSDVGHTHDDRYYTETEIDSKLSGKVTSSTFTGHTGNGTVHITGAERTYWNGKANLADIPAPTPHTTVGNVKPTDGSMWYQVI